jgi:prepilin-type N-terminal cleavage/methylation domain-containing protein
MNRGFTLIETIVYLALMGLLLSGAILASYQILTSSSALDTKNTTAEEAAFVMRKLDWAFASASDFTPIGSHEIQISRYDTDTIDIRWSAGSPVEMQETGSGGFQPITTDNISVTDLTFVENDVGSLKGVDITLQVNGLTFTATHYIRQ